MQLSCWLLNEGKLISFRLNFFGTRCCFKLTNDIRIYFMYGTEYETVHLRGCKIVVRNSRPHNVMITAHSELFHSNKNVLN